MSKSFCLIASMLLASALLGGCGGGSGEDEIDAAASVQEKKSTAPLSKGINLAGAEFGADKLPGRHGWDYLWPPATDIGLYADAGFKTIRIPFLWERMQPELFKPLSTTELANLDATINAAAARDLTVILNLHNFGLYRGNPIGSDAVPATAFHDFWGRLARRYKDSTSVVFGLMNEPHYQTATEWANIAQYTIWTIRGIGATQLILVPGSNWSGAHSWTTKQGGISNADAFAKFKDPFNNYMFEMHQYFDTYSSGTSPDCVSETIGVERLQAATAWLRQNNKKGFLGEFGASTNPVCISALKNTLTYLGSNSDVWQGWTYWAGAKWFGNYMFNIYPPNKATSAQFTAIEEFLR